MISLLTNSLPSLLAQATDMTTDMPPTQQMNPVVGLILGVVWLVVMLVMVATMWKIFSKAGEAGWKSLIPLYNVIVLCKITGKPAWWMFLIPFVNFWALIVTCISLAKVFGKTTGYGVGILLLGFIFLPLLAFGGATYQGPLREPATV